MKKKTLLVVTTTLLSLPIMSYAQPMDGSWYISGSGGWAMMGDTDFSTNSTSGSFHDATNISAAVGAHLDDNMRTEFELSYRNADIERRNFNGDLSTWSLMANGYYDFGTGRYKPYIMAGIGAVDHVADISQSGNKIADDNDWVFGYQAGFGVNYDLSDQTVLFTGYRYQGSVDADPDNVDIDYNSHEILAGLRFYLGNY